MQPYLSFCRPQPQGCLWIFYLASPVSLSQLYSCPALDKAHTAPRAQAHNGQWKFSTELASAQVRPWLADVSADLHAPDGPLNQVEYYGLYQGRSPQPQSNPGFIMMQSNLVVYGSDEGEAAASS